MNNDLDFPRAAPPGPELAGGAMAGGAMAGGAMAGGAMAGAAPLDQSDIDALFDDIGGVAAKKSGLRAMLESKIISHERLPMLEVVCDRMVRSFATSMRNLTSDAIDVTLEEVTSIRFGEFMNNVAQPAMIGVFDVDPWDGFGIVNVESGLIYAVVDALLGGRRGTTALLIDGRGFTTIETSLVSRMLDLVLVDLTAAFAPIAPITAKLERIEMSPRFAAIAGPTNLCAVARFRVDMEGRGGKFSVLLPYATLEPVREKLLQRFMGEKLGGDAMWASHMESEIRKTEISVDVVLGERQVSINDLRGLAVGHTLALDKGPNDPLDIQCGGIRLGQAQIGQSRSRIAVRLVSTIARDIRR